MAIQIERIYRKLWIMTKLLLQIYPVKFPLWFLFSTWILLNKLVMTSKNRTYYFHLRFAVIPSYDGILRLPNRNQSRRRRLVRITPFLYRYPCKSATAFIVALPLGHYLFSARLDPTWKKARPFFPSFYLCLFFLHAVDDEPHGVSYWRSLPTGKLWGGVMWEKWVRFIWFPK